ncbi:unnamed protein product [Prunus brigantina]
MVASRKYVKKNASTSKKFNFGVTTAKEPFFFSSRFEVFQHEGFHVDHVVYDGECARDGDFYVRDECWGKKKVGRTRKILANISNNGNGNLLLALLVSHLMLV